MSTTTPSTATLTSTSTASATTTTIPYYNYPPNGQGGPHIWVSVLYLILFGTTTGLHFLQSIYYKRWYLLYTTVFGGLGEITTYACRLYGGHHPMGYAPFVVQIVFSIFSPTFLSAGNFIIFGRLIRYVDGQRYAVLTPKRFTRFFLSFDIASLVVQSLGGSVAASTNVNTERIGSNIALGGIAAQTFAIVVYSGVAFDFVWRFYKDRPVTRHGSDRRLLESGKDSRDPSLIELRGTGEEEALARRNDPEVLRRMNLMLYGLAFSTLLLLIRGVYRLVEFIDGWGGRIQSTERYFTILDGMMIFFAMLTLNYTHPGRLLRDPRGRL